MFVFGTAVVARSRPWVNLGTLSECKEMTQVQVNDGRSFLLCVVWIFLVAFCGVTHSHTLKETPSRPSGGALLLGA